MWLQLSVVPLLDDKWCCTRSVQKRASFLLETNYFLVSVGCMVVIFPPDVICIGCNVT